MGGPSGRGYSTISGPQVTCGKVRIRCKNQKGNDLMPIINSYPYKHIHCYCRNKDTSGEGACCICGRYGLEKGEAMLEAIHW